MNTIRLTKGMTATVSPEDYERLSMHRWCVTVGGSRGKHPYAIAWDSKLKKRIYMHRVVLVADSAVVDHINGDTLDNRRENLRPATLSQNSANCRRKIAKSGLRNVEKVRSRFRVVIRLEGKKYQFGSYATAEEAAAARNNPELLARMTAAGLKLGQL